MKLGRPLALSLVAAASLLSHAKGISAPPLDYHHHRQVNTAAISRNYHRNGLKFLKPQIDWEGGTRGRAATEFPLYMWLTGLLWPLFGLGDVWGRLLSVLFSALTAVYLYLFIEKKAGPEPALYGGILFSCLPLEIYFGRTIQPEALALMATMASIFHWDRFVEQGRPAHWAAAAVMSFLAVSHKLPYAYSLVPLAAIAWLKWGSAMLRRRAVWLALGAVVLGVWGWYRYASAGVYVVPAHKGEFLRILEYHKLPFFLQFQLLSRFPELCATHAGTLLVILGFRELVIKRGQAFFAIWPASLLVYLAVGGGYLFYHEYTSLPFTLLNACLMGVGLQWLKDRAQAAPRRLRAWSLAGVALLVLSMPVYAAVRIGHWYRLNFNFLQNAGRAADAVSSPDDLFLTHQRAASVFLYYLDRRGWSWDLAEAGETQIGRVEDKIREGARFFMAGKEGLFADRQGFYARWFYDRYPVVYDRDGILIFRLTEPSGPPRGGSTPEPRSRRGSRDSARRAPG